MRLAIDLVKVEPDGSAARATSARPDGDRRRRSPSAVELHRSGPRGFRYVTAAGEVLEADGTLRAGPLTAAMGLAVAPIRARSDRAADRRGRSAHRIGSAGNSAKATPPPARSGRAAEYAPQRDLSVQHDQGGDDQQHRAEQRSSTVVAESRAAGARSRAEPVARPGGPAQGRRVQARRAAAALEAGSGESPAARSKI